VNEYYKGIFVCSPFVGSVCGQQSLLHCTCCTSVLQECNVLELVSEILDVCGSCKSF